MKVNESSKKESVIALSSAELIPIIKETLFSSLPFVLSVTGNSMRPTLRNSGDKVELLSKKQRAVKKGEIVFFERENGGCILHRVLKINGDTLLVNGDAQPWTETVKMSQVIGVVNRLCRKGKWISCDSFLYRVYSKIIVHTLFLRKVYAKVRSILRNN